MAREILFRGKRSDNGEWVQGSYVRGESGKHYIFRGNDNGHVYDPDEVNTVDPATIGQFTGLLDKNGNKVFEGDIFTADEYPFVDDGRPNYYGLVEWIFAGFQYVLKLANTDKRGISDGVNEILEDAGWVEVIGNIHEEREVKNG